MELTNLEGLIEAIEAESKNPSPSHQNLARLVSMAFHEINSKLFPQTNTVSTGSVTFIDNSTKKTKKKKK